MIFIQNVPIHATLLTTCYTRLQLIATHHFRAAAGGKPKHQRQVVNLNINDSCNSGATTKRWQNTN